jgi:GAF domain-containing protein
MTDDDGALSVDELAEYCRTQAGLLSGRVETIGTETDALLDEIDDDIAALRSRLAEHGSRREGPTASSAGEPTDDAGETDDLEALEALEADLEEKQVIAEAKQARQAAFQDLAAAYVDLAEDLESEVDDGRTALDRVIRLERDRDAPVYFDDRQTVLEAAAEADRSATDDESVTDDEWVTDDESVTEEESVPEEDSATE